MGTDRSNYGGLLDTTTERWKTEYSLKGIPSSFRSEPSQIVLDFAQFLQQKQFNACQILDIGCGKGRNGAYLASLGHRVNGIDLVEENIAALNIRAANEGLDLSGAAHDISTGFPFPDASFDCAIDIFCYKHQISLETRSLYKKELLRVLKPNGLFLLSLASIDDGFYGPLLKDSPNPAQNMIIDPFTGIASILFTQADVQAAFDPEFVLEFSEKRKSESPMHGKTYQRSVLSFIMRSNLNAATF